MDMRHRASLVPQLENSTPAHFVHILFENFHPKVFEPQLSHFDEEEWWVESNEPPSNPTIEQIAYLPNLPRDDPSEPCKEQPGEVATDLSSGHSEMPPCMEVSLEPQIPYPPAQPPSPQQSSVCLRSPSVTMVEEEAEREASMHSVEKAGMPQCADPSPDAEGGLASAFSKMVLDAPKSEEQRALEDHLRRQAWEVGQIDYLGQDSFENIWKKIMHTINTGPSSKAEPSQPAPPPAEVPQSQPASIPSAPPQPSPAPAPQAPAPPPKAPSPPKVAPTPPKATPPPPIVPPSPDVAPPTPLSPESTSPVQPSAPPPTPVKPTVPSPPPAAEPAATPAVAPAKVAATAAPPSPAPAAAKAAPPKAAPAATPEEGAKGTAPVAPKRKGAAQQQQQQGGSGRGKSAGQKGKK